MSGAAPMFVRTWSVGDLACTLTVPNPGRSKQVQAVVEWAPHTPYRLSAAELDQYRAGRNAALAHLAAELGINAAVLEL